jgi:hypothetical protein
MKKWEYLCLFANRRYDAENKSYQDDKISFTNMVGREEEYPADQKQALLNKLGTAGWELVCVDSDISTWYGGAETTAKKYFLKRQLNKK